MNKPASNPVQQFQQEILESASTYKNDTEWQELSNQWLQSAFLKKYMYNFSSLGRPIIQLPADMIALQEIIWEVRPDLIIEMGIAHGGSLILSASMLALLDYCDAAEHGQSLDPRKPKRRVLGVDIDIRAHNRKMIEDHPLASHIDMLEGSSISADMIKKVKDMASKYSRILVCLDSNHTHDHVLAELEAYAPLVSKGSYCLAYDTIIEDLPEGIFPDRPWTHGNNSKTAVHSYLNKLKKETVKGADGQRLHFEIDKNIENKLLLSCMPDGILRRI